VRSRASSSRKVASLQLGSKPVRDRAASASASSAPGTWKLGAAGARPLLAAIALLLDLHAQTAQFARQRLPGQAHGLSFSVPNGVEIPPSLKNIHVELRDDLGIEPPPHGNLERWADNGVLLLNAVLTVRAHSAGSHRNKGWEHFTDRMIQVVSAKSDRVVFILWGNYARAKKSMIDTSVHAVIESPHPSPLSASRGFFGSKPFSRANAALEAAGREPVDWRL